MKPEDVIAYYANLPYATRIVPDTCDGAPCYLAVHPELRGCKAQGATPGEALANLAEAREDYLAALVEEGLDLPLPEGMARVSQISPNIFTIGFATVPMITWPEVVTNAVHPHVDPTQLKVYATS